jgi:alpha-glucosidase/alpha-D-xyloside xylohydrolase
MTELISRRDALKHLGAAGAGLALGGSILRGRFQDIVVAGHPVELAVATLSPSTVRLTLLPLEGGQAQPVPFTGALVEDDPGDTLARGRDGAALDRVTAGDLVVRFTDDPPMIRVETLAGETVQLLTMDAREPGLSFLLPDGPLLGLGEGGEQFDRKGTWDRMRNGQVTEDNYSLAIHGTRMPVQWLVGTDGWGMFVHQPYGAFDFRGEEGVFTPREDTPLPLDLFVVKAADPKEIMAEYARITGLPEMPARWTLGYMQSSRTLDGPGEILGVARTFREKRLPCDTLIYLGTEFAPSGWNTRNGEFTWHPGNFPDPKAMLDELHDLGFKVVVHIVVEGRRLLGTVHDPCTADPLPPGRTPEDDRWPRERQVACYWPAHEPLMDVGVDGWWPDQGDGFDGPSRFNRHRMYWEGTQLYRPNERPFALHRNASPGVQRYGGFIWSGDVRSYWETLATHVAVAVNTGLSGLPFWGTDIGGFNPTEEYTAELHVRWFQFGAFSPSFRAHGRHWHLKLPWGWEGGDGGPMESRGWRAAPEELNSPHVEPILKKYLELRYRLMPYLYTAVKETTETGLPLMRALWLHFPDDPSAVARGDEFLWGGDILVAPVVEKGAASRRLYLPPGTWYDFWEEEVVDGGREVSRSVDLETTPLYVRAGAVIPLGPVRQWTGQDVDEPMTLLAFPGADGTSTLYEDDGLTFDYRDGEYSRIDMTWEDAPRTLSLRLREGSRMLQPGPRVFHVRLAGSEEVREVRFDGSPLEVRL